MAHYEFPRGPDPSGRRETLAHGLLTITAPKAAAAKAQTIAIGGQAREPRPARATS